MRWFSPKHRGLFAFGITEVFIPLGILRDCWFLSLPSSQGLGVSQLAFVPPVGTAKGSASCQPLCPHVPWLALASPARSLQMQ